MSEPAQPVRSIQPGSPAPPPVPAPGPTASAPATSAHPSASAPSAASSGRPGESGAGEDPLRRKLLIGAALLLAMASIYAGVFNVGRLAQIVLAAGATMAVVLALTSGDRRRNF
jgi:hypothetical protein